jgi:hypothetical protein
MSGDGIGVRSTTGFREYHDNGGLKEEVSTFMQGEKHQGYINIVLAALAKLETVDT